MTAPPAPPEARQPAAARPAATPDPGPAPPGLRWFLLAWLVALALLAANHPGQLVIDTKLGVDIDPAGFLARLWPLWDPLAWLGTLQDQYIGYAFPMAPFYLAGHLAGLPAWLTERLWMSLLVAVGFTGLARLAAALRIGSPRTRLLAAAVFALWPTFTILVGSNSASILPGVLAPWAVLPLVRAVHAEIGPVRAAALSGVAAACMGGVNAVVTLEVLLAPGLFILVAARGRRRAELAACWGAAIVAATAWWAGPLLLQGRYAFSFLPYIEQAATTTRTMSATAVLTGVGDWTAYVNPGTPWLTAGWTLVTVPAAILASAVAAAVALAGLARRDLPHGAWLRLTAGLVAAGALAGYWGPLGGPFHGTADRLLDGTLAAFRNVYKLQAVLALVLALALAHGLARRPRWPRLAWPCPAFSGRFPGRSGPARALPVRLVAGIAAGLVLAGLALPYLTGQVLSPGPFPSVPRYWYRVAAFLAARSPREPAFVVPGGAHGIYVWGDPIDDPLEPLATSPWVERGTVPYGGGASQDFVNTVESAIESGQQVPGLAAYLARAGVRYVVVRNDLSPAMPGAVAPQVVHATLAQSGFRRVAAFGPRIPAVPAAQAAAAISASVLAQLPGARRAYPAVEIYAADPGTPGPPGPAEVLPARQTVLVDGGPGALLPLAGQGILDGRPVVVAGDPLLTAPARWVVTDGARRADTLFGQISGNVSETYTATQVNPPDELLGDAGGPPRQLLPVPARRQTVAVLSGAASVTASSAGSWVQEAPQYDPVNAFDGNPATAWTVGVPGAAGQWIQVTFGRRRLLPGRAGIRLLTDLAARPVASRVEVSTAAGRVSTTLRRTSAVQSLRLPPGPTRWLRVTITRASRSRPGAAAAGAGAGVRDILIPGVRVQRLLRPAQDPAGRRAPAVAFSFSQTLPDPAQLVSPAAYPPLARRFTTPAATPLRLTATAVALPGPALTALLARLTTGGPGQVRISASSTLGSLPSLAPGDLLATGPWIAGGPHPVLRLSWTGDRRIADLALTPDNGIGAFPEKVRITSPDGVREAAVGFGGLVTLSPPLVTSQLSISFPASEPAGAAAAAQRGRLPIALGRLTIPALAGLAPARPDPAAPFALRCGQGPPLTVDGHRYATAVSGPISALTSFRPVQVRLCAAAPSAASGPGPASPPGPGTPGRAAAVPSLSLPAGRHTLTAAIPAPFAFTSVALTSDAPASAPRLSPASRAAAATAATAATANTAGRALRVITWADDRRSLRVAAGPRSYLELHQNANPGWLATLNGRPLTPVTLDGWQQGYLLPAGHGGLVTLTYSPDGLYHVLLVTGALAALALLVLALPVPLRRRRAPPAALSGMVPSMASAPSAPPATPTQTAPAVAAGVPPRAAVWSAARLAALAGLIILAGGLVALAVPALAVLAWWRPRWLPAVAGAGLVAAGLIAATVTTPETFGIGAFSAAAQACALIALAAALMPALPGRRSP